MLADSGAKTLFSPARFRGKDYTATGLALKAKGELDHLIFVGDEPAREVGADEPGGPRDQDALRGLRHPTPPRWPRAARPLVASEG